MVSPIVKTYMQFAATTMGRDKAYRFVQYFCRFLSYYAMKYGAPKAIVQPLNALKASIGLTRKLMRIGKPIDFIVGAKQAMKSTPDDLLRLLRTVKQVFMALYMCSDSLQWVHGANVYKFRNHATIVRIGAKFWLTALACSWLAGIYQLYENRVRYSSISPRLMIFKDRQQQTDEILLEAQTISSERHLIMRQLIQDSLDILIPSHTLLYHNLGEGIVGLAGAITAFMGGQPQWFKLYNAKF
ncbi:Peroxisomal membrane protein PMP27 [Dimargaris cristalligena]|uniref:Peroxisomal biogenesis factor 11 n=1 Tax=Dimargaris cristalligena TaxID=215637 RepID=A0A4P9ZW82_9FUNG|nr:Peroxisomal membrane protein PMP27 [Dimargaris cristalligena]RKP36930.1 peroxisomal biogenesis factor 11 [Dimargaris cristalligena]|eukprot:RKP36930.1 peroxisomal biogenesis factor 11 [Dimargaris cristalligena]